MTSRERLLAAMNRKEPDRVPVLCQLSWGHTLLNSGIRPSEFVFNPEAFAEGFWIMREKYNFDGIFIDVGFHESEDFRKKMRVKAVDGGDMCYMPDGDRVFCPVNDDPRFYPAHKVEIPEIEDLDVDKVHIDLDVPEWKVEAYKITIKRSKGMYAVIGETYSPMFELIEYMGIEKTMMSFLLSPEKIHVLLERFLEKSIAVAKAQILTGIDAIGISSPFAGGKFISRDCYKEFVLPYEKKLVQAIHSFRPGFIVYVHTCGSIGDRLDLMVENGVDGIECMDPAPLGDSDLADAKKRVGDRVFLKGNMDSVNVLMKATPESLEAYVKQKIMDGGKGGGYILSSACSVSPGVSPEIMKLLVPLAEKYGRYPLKFITDGNV